MTIPQGLIPSPFQSRLSAELEAEDFIDVCGQAVPVCLSGTDAEYDAFRNSAGIIDFSMLFKWEISGSGAVGTANKVVSRDVSKLRPSQIAYGVVVDDDGLMMDDCTIFRYEDGRVMIIGGNIDVGNVISAHLEPDTEVNQIRSQVGVLSLQGPKSRIILQTLTETDLSNEAFPYYTFKAGVLVAGLETQINRLGFTAELGYEIMVDAESAPLLWDAVSKAGEPFGLLPCAADALMRVRVEAGMVMGGLEYDENTSPYECRMGWAVDLDKDAFQGKDSLLALKDKALTTIVSVVTESRPEGLDNAEIEVNGVVVGKVTMAITSPQLGGKTLALAKIKKSSSATGTLLHIVTDGSKILGEVVATPVYDPERKKVRS